MKKLIKLLAIIASLLLLNACVVVESGPSNKEKASDINVQLGIGYLQQNNLEVANQKLIKAIRLNPDSAMAHNAYAILQERLLHKEKAEEHYRLATELDTLNSEANNNYGIFLCRSGREKESEHYFMQALENPLYKTPEFAYTSAAFCLMKVENYENAENYLTKALAAKSDFPDALITMAELKYKTRNFELVEAYLNRLHEVDRPSAESLWLSIQTAIQLDRREKIAEYGQQLEQKFPKSAEYQSWLKIQ